jgi:apolipoprotein D and lipocalin family protein
MNATPKWFWHRTLHRPFGTLAALLCAAFLSSCTRIPDGVVPVSGFEVSRYFGTWHEIMRLDHRFERGLSHVTATYGRNDDGTVSVVNRGLDRDTCEWNSVEGYAEFIGDPQIGSLAVTFFWPITGGYHIFALDKDNYQWAAVSGPSRDYLWILSRQPNLDASIRDQLVEKAKRLGFAVEKLIEVEHGPTDCLPGES